MAAAAGSAKACYGSTVNRTTQESRNKMRAAALKATHGGTTRASPELAFGALPGTWRADPEAVELLSPLLELAKRVRHGTLDRDIWADVLGRAGCPRHANGPSQIGDEYLRVDRHSFRLDKRCNRMESNT